MCNIGLPNHRYGGFSRRHSQSRSDDEIGRAHV